MGQLEKYGLYVLCLVIFLILGVSIWGGGDLPQNGRRGAPPSNSELQARTQSGAPVGKTEAPPQPSLGELEAFLRPPAERPKNEPAKVDGKAVDASLGKEPGKGGDKAAAPGGDLGKPATPPAPPADAGRKTHKVQSGDSFESISKQHFGSAALRAEIGRLNSRLEPTKLKVGQDVLLPTAAEAQAILERGKSKPVSGPGPAATGTYTVVKGDTLEGIALRQLGSRSRLADLQQANPGVTVLKIGAVLQLPKK